MHELREKATEASIAYLCMLAFFTRSRTSIRFFHSLPQDMWLRSLSIIVYVLTTFGISFLLFRIRNCLAQLYAKDITPDDKQELDEALQREVL